MGTMNKNNTNKEKQPSKIGIVLSLIVILISGGYTMNYMMNMPQEKTSSTNDEEDVAEEENTAGKEVEVKEEASITEDSKEENSTVVKDGTYTTEVQYDAMITDDVLHVDSSLSHYTETDLVEDYAKGQYRIPISKDCVIVVFEAESYEMSYEEATEFLTNWFTSGNGLPFTITVENGMIVEMSFSS